MKFSKRSFVDLDKESQITFASDVISDCQDLLPRITETMGCGNYGCAFLTEDDTILKFTVQEKEGKAAKWVVSTPDAKIQPSLPRVKDVWSLNECHPYDYTFYFIEREPLNDLQVDDLDLVKTLISDFEMDFYPESKAGLPSKTDITDYFSSHIKQLSPRDQVVIRAIANLYGWLCQQGIWLDDIELDNWGQRLDGTPVIRDLGAMLIF